MNDVWIILTASLVATCSAMLGCFLILRKMAMLGDAIAHAVLPGLVIAYFVSGDNTGLPILIGAAITGVLVTLLIELLTKKTGLQEDSSIGIAFTFLFSVGVIMINLLGRNLHIDQDCVLYGEIAYVPLETQMYFGAFIPKQPVILGGALLIIGLLIWRGYKGLMMTTFDQSYAVATGVSATFWHYALMSGVSLNTVVAFESVGAILVIAFLVGPPTIAYLLTGKLKNMIALSVVIGIISCIIGYFWAKMINSSIAGCISVVIGAIFLIVFIYVRIKSKYFQKDAELPLSL